LGACEAQIFDAVKLHPKDQTAIGIVALMDRKRSLNPILKLLAEKSKMSQSIENQHSSAVYTLYERFHRLRVST